MSDFQILVKAKLNTTAIKQQLAEISKNTAFNVSTQGNFNAQGKAAGSAYSKGFQSSVITQMNSALGQLTSKESSAQYSRNFQTQLNGVIAPGLNSVSKSAKQSAEAFKDLFATTKDGVKGLSDTQRETLKLSGGLKQSAQEAMGFTGRIKEAISSASQWAIAMGILYGSLRKIQEGMQFVYDFDNQMNSIQMITKGTTEETQALANTYNDLATELSSNTLDVAKNAEEWLRQGRTVADTNTLIKASMVLSKVGMIEAAEAASLLTSSINGYGLSAQEAMSVVDKMSAIDVAAATSTKDLALALAQTASSAKIAGVTLDEALSYIAVVSDVTQKSAESIGNSFKTIFARMQQVKIGTLIDPESGEDISNVDKVLNLYGIHLRDAQGQFRDTGDVLDELALKWKDYEATEKSEIMTTIAGVRQRENGMVLLENYDKALKLQTISAESAGSATEKFAIYQESASASTERLTNQFQKLFMGIDSGLIKGFLNAITKILEITNALGGLRTILIAVASILITWKADAILMFFIQLPNLIVTAIATLRGFATSMSIAQASLGAIGLVLTAVSIGYSLFANAQEKSTAKAFEASEEIKNQTASLNDLKSQIDLIVAGTGTEVEKRDDLLVMLKNMNSAYDTEAGKIKTVNELRDEAISKIKEESKASAQAYLETNAYALTAANKYMTEKVDVYTGKGKSASSREEILKGLKEQVTDWYVKSVMGELTLGEKILYKATQATYDKALAEYEKQKAIYDQGVAALEVISKVDTPVKSQPIHVETEEQRDARIAKQEAANAKVEAAREKAEAKAQKIADALAKIEEEKQKLLEDNLKKAIDIKMMVIEAERKAVEDSYDKQIDAQKKLNEDKQDELDLMKAKEALLNAQGQKTRRVYYEGQGWVWEANKEAIAEAQEALTKLTESEALKTLEAQKTSALGKEDLKKEDYEALLLQQMKATTNEGLRAIYGGILGMTELEGSWYDKSGQKAFKNGGVIDYTGGAQVHGSPTSAEVVFSSSQASALYDIVKNITSPSSTKNSNGGSGVGNVIYNIGTINLPGVKNSNDFIKDLQLKTQNR